ncbi:hypothetical protein BB561_005416 [Smittium simulii]|uniref:Uncharacterized protein n=1 Tax=Smittium simulii TaxID=133385 RepID=A0A2T9YAI4_9FUNG|nr:hypothetical protein BB561_005416 [Smittium simulii]
MNKIFVLSALLSAVTAQVKITNPTDSRIINKICEDYVDFIRAANAAIADLVAKNNAAAEAVKKALNGQTTVPVTFNESTIKALLMAAPEILQYPAVWDVVDSKDANNTLDADDLVFSTTSSSTLSSSTLSSSTLSSSTLSSSTLSSSTLSSSTLSSSTPSSSLPTATTTANTSSTTSTSNGINNNSSNNIKKTPTVITNPTDSRILKEISDDYNDFIRNANALNGQTTVPVTFNEATIKALLIAAPEILQYPAVWNVIGSKDTDTTLDVDEFVFSMSSSSSSGTNNASPMPTGYGDSGGSDES